MEQTFSSVFLLFYHTLSTKQNDRQIRDVKSKIDSSYRCIWHNSDDS